MRRAATPDRHPAVVVPAGIPTITAVAEQAGVSITTASLVLNGKAASVRLKAETVERVRAVAARLGYRPDHRARSLRLRCTKTFGVILPDLRNHFHASVAAALSRAATARGYQVLVADSGEDAAHEAELVLTFADRRVDALLVASTRPRADALPGLPPLIHLDRRVEGARHWVVSDNRVAARALGDALRQRGWGRSGTIAFIGGQAGTWTNEERWAGFAGAFAAGRLLRSDGAFTPAWGYQAMSALAAGAMPTAVFTASFTILEGVLAWWRERGGSLPALATFDHHPLLDALSVPVCAVAQDAERIAVLAAAGAVALAMDAGTAPLQEVVPASLRLPAVGA